MSDYDFQCTNCGHQLDGDVMHNKPDICPVCGCTDFEDADLAEELETRSEIINKQDEFLKEQRNEKNNRKTS